MPIRFARDLIALCCLLLVAFSAAAAINLAERVPTDPDVKIGKLPNGLTYFIRKNDHPRKSVELRLVVKAGSVLEDDDQQGLAHLVEHMAFNGSTHFRKKELVSYLQSIGVGYGSDLNASTSFDETIYQLTIPTDEKRHLETGFLVLGDWAHGVIMDDAVIDNERTIVLEELRLGKGASDRMQRQLLPEMYNRSRYADRLPGGQESILKTFKPDAARRFYADWYRPDLMAVVVVGDILPAQAEKMIVAHFGKLKNPANPRPRTVYRIAPRKASASAVVTDAEATDNAVGIEYQIAPTPAQSSFADYRRSLIEEMAWSMLSLRLEEITEQADPPFLSAQTTVEAMGPGFQNVSSSVGIGPRGIEPAVGALIQENERARRFGFTANELERAKKDALSGLNSEYKERRKTDSSVYTEDYVHAFVQPGFLPGIALEFQVQRELLPGITLDEINAFMREAIPTAAPKLVYYTGSSKPGSPVPKEDALLRQVELAHTRPVESGAEKSVAAHLLPDLPKAGRIVAEKTTRALGTTELVLSNGVKVILKPTSFKGDEVLLRGERYGGESLFDDRDVFSARYAVDVADVMGMGTFSPLDLEKTLAGKSAHVHVGMSNYIETIEGGSSSDDIETMFQLLRLKLAAPRKDDGLFKAFIGSRQEQARNTLAQPEAVFADTSMLTLSSHPRAPRVPTPDDFGHVDLNRAMAIYAERFGSAKGLTLTIVGNFSVKKIKPLVATYLASLPTADIATAYKDMGIRPVAGVIKKDVRSGLESKSQVSLYFGGETPYSEVERIRLNALIEVMNLRIDDVIREKLGLIYSGSMSGKMGSVPYDAYFISANLPCGPENVDKVSAALFAEIEKIKQQGPQRSDLDKIKLKWQKSHAMNLRDNEYWLGQLSKASLRGTDPVMMLQFDKLLAAVTPADVQRAAQRYFRMDDYVQMTLYPEK
ncbi:MAG: insulinase family protein [Massilia sp.]